MRIVDPESGAVLPEDETGLIQVRGPGVMKGYLDRADLTAAVIRDEYYSTGDIGHLDDDGFLFITDRLSRFSKIGGEMVPHGRVEQALQDAAGQRDQQVFCVTGVPDEKKGERLVVLHTLDASDLPAILVTLRESGLPNLFIPREDQFIGIDAIPLARQRQTRSSSRPRDRGVEPRYGRPNRPSAIRVWAAERGDDGDACAWNHEMLARSRRGIGRASKGGRPLCIATAM